MSQILAGAGPYSLVKKWDVDGTQSDVGTVTIGIVDGNGDEVVATGTATTKGGSGATTTYTYSLADQASPDQLKVTWTRSDTGADLVDRVEIVGAWLFTERQARTFRAKADAAAAQIPLNSPDEYPDDVIADERTRLADDLERWTGRSWIPRYARVELPGSGGSFLPLEKGRCRTSDGYQLNRPGRFNDIATVLTATVSGTSVDVDDIEIDELRGGLILTTGIWSYPTQTSPLNVIVEYVYGMPFPVDSVDRIALKELVDRLVPSGVPDRALRWDLPDGSAMSIIQPGGPMRNVSRLPEVNAWVKSHDRKVLLG